MKELASRVGLSRSRLAIAGVALVLPVIIGGPLVRAREHAFRTIVDGLPRPMADSYFCLSTRTMPPLICGNYPPSRSYVRCGYNNSSSRMALCAGAIKTNFPLV